jgi:YD repeat-containing protein
MAGSGATVLEPAASGTVDNGLLTERTFFNDGTLTVPSGDLEESAGAKFGNNGTFNVNEGQSAAIVVAGSGTEPLFVNKGVFQRTENVEVTALVKVKFENYGIFSGNIAFEDPVFYEESLQFGGAFNPSTPGHPHPTCGKPVSCATGNESETQTDFAIGGRGVGLDLTRTYNSQAGAEGVKGAFGYGWSSSFSDHLVIEKTTKKATLVQASGSTVPFTEGSGEAFTAPVWTQDTLSGSEGTGYTVTLADQIKYKFAGTTGRLESVTDRDGNATTLTYNSEGHLEAITDPVGRKIKLKYNSEGLVESAEDPMGHVVKYTYESGNLKSVTQPAESSLRWQFKYDGSHQLTEVIDGRGSKTTIEYNSSHQVVKETDSAEHRLKFEYEPFHTKITNETTGSVTDERFTSAYGPVSITHGYGTSSAITETFTYNEGGYVTSVADGDGHTTSYEYDSAGDRTSMIDPDKDETKWTYDSTHDVETITTPKGETTTIKRESHGNPEMIERPAPGGKTQITKYKYTAHGEVESVTNPLEHTWKYEYDSKGDRTAEIDPEGNKRTWEYNEDSQETGTVSPRGHVKAGEEEKFRTKIERDAQGRPVKITDPLGHVTEYKYDGDDNVEKMTDGNKHTTTYTYNGDNQPIKVEAPNKSVTETEYDGAGQVIAQTDGNKHTTKYKRNAAEEVTEVTNPLGRVTTKEYDGAGNLIKLTDPAKRTTTYTYDPANRLTEVSYSSGKPSAIKYEYDKDGDRTKMTDGTGTTIYTYDQLDRLTEGENGHKEVIKYEYDLANDQTKITYPSGKSVERTFDKDGRLEKITDWLKHETKFTYDPDSDLKETIFPSETKDEDKYTYNDADQTTEIKIVKSTETLASLVYTRDSDGQVKKTTSKGLPGAEVTENAYDENNRLTQYGSIEYKYDAANNPTKEGSSENSYNEGDELEKRHGCNLLIRRTWRAHQTNTLHRPRHHLRLQSGWRSRLGRTAERRRNHRNQRQLRIQRRRTADVTNPQRNHNVSSMEHHRRRTADTRRWNQQLHLRPRRSTRRANQQHNQHRDLPTPRPTRIDTATDGVYRENRSDVHLRSLWRTDRLHRDRDHAARLRRPIHKH